MAYLLSLLLLLFSGGTVFATPPEHHDTPSVLDQDNVPEELKGDLNGGTFIPELMNMLFMLGLLVLLILLASWYLKRVVNTRIQQANDTSEIKIEERRALTAKTSIYLLRIKDKHVLIAESSNGITLLSSSRSLADSLEEDDESAPSFNTILKEKINKNEPPQEKS